MCVGGRRETTKFLPLHFMKDKAQSAADGIIDPE